MESEKSGNQKTPFRKGFIAVILISIAIFGIYNLAIDFLKYLGII
tara:strand:+ start:207456 stop:207590 length:135 start_codon:yes stop_codon:yes gene_type:complete